MILAFTGHRPERLGGYGPSPLQDWVRGRIRFYLETLQPRFTISGMALGLDQWVAETCVELRMGWIAAVPFLGQESRWPEAAQAHYRNLLSYADKVKVVSGAGYSAEKMQIRNRWMVDKADCLVAFWDGSASGTANCVNYAISQGKEVVRVDPGDFNPETI